MNVRKALQWAIKHLRTSNSPNLDAEVLLSFTLKKPKEFLFAHPEQKLTNLQLKTYQLLTNRRAQGEPVAYLTGRKEFYGLDFKVSPAVLIPRPETELIIDCLRNNLTIEQLNNSTIIDVGTGSGCIIISLLKNLLTYKLKNLKTDFYATDLSPAALKIARLNAQRHGVTHRIKFLQGNLLGPFFKFFKTDELKNLKTYKLIITSNLPYLTTRQWRQTSPDIRLYEPRQALDGGPDGLKYFRELFQQIKKLITYNLKLITLIEIDPAQTKKIKGLAKKYFPKAEIQIKKDLAGQKRVIIIKI